MGEGLVEAFVKEISTLEGPTRMTEFFNAFYKKHNTDKAGLRRALEAPTNGTWANALGSMYSDLITFRDHHFEPVRAGQPQQRGKDAHHDPHPRLPEGLANHVKRWKGTVAAFVSSSSKMKKRQNRRAIATAAAGTPCPTCGRNLRATGKRHGTFSTVEHIVPLNLGGDNTYTGAFPQCVAMCFDCNAVRNTLVGAEKASRTGTSPNRFDDLVEFLILQVYDPTSIGDSPLWKAFEREFTLRTKRSPEPVSHRNTASKSSRSKKDARTWIVVPGPSTNPAALVHEISLDRIESHVDRIVIVRQEDASHTDLHSWIGLDFQPMIAPFGASDLHLSVAKLSYQRKGLVDVYIHAEFSSSALNSLITTMGGHVVEFTTRPKPSRIRNRQGVFRWLRGFFQSATKHSDEPAHQKDGERPTEHSTDDDEDSKAVTISQDIASHKGERSLETSKNAESVQVDDEHIPEDIPQPDALQEEAPLSVSSGLDSSSTHVPDNPDPMTTIKVPMLNAILKGVNFLLPASPRHAAEILNSMNRHLPQASSIKGLQLEVMGEIRLTSPELAKSRINRTVSKFKSSMAVLGLSETLPSRSLSDDELSNVIDGLHRHWKSVASDLRPLTDEEIGAAETYFEEMVTVLNLPKNGEHGPMSTPLQTNETMPQHNDLRARMEYILSGGPKSMNVFIGQLSNWQRAQNWNEVGAKGLALHHNLPPKTPVNETLAMNYSDLINISGPQGTWTVSLIRGIEPTVSNEDVGQNE